MRLLFVARVAVVLGVKPDYGVNQVGRVNILSHHAPDFHPLHIRETNWQCCIVSVYFRLSRNYPVRVFCDSNATTRYPGIRRPSAHLSRLSNAVRGSLNLHHEFVGQFQNIASLLQRYPRFQSSTNLYYIYTYYYRLRWGEVSLGVIEDGFREGVGGYTSPRT